MSRRAIAALSLVVLLLVPLVASAGLVVGANVNVTRRPDNQVEAAIAINPANPNNLFMASNNDAVPAGLFGAFSMDGGLTWHPVGASNGTFATGADSLPAACCDPTVAFDQLGNLFVGYITNTFSTGLHAIVVLSVDGGQTFSLLVSLGTDVDQPTITAGAGTVWITYKDFGQAATPLVAHGAAISGLGAVGAFGPAQVVPGSGSGNFGDIAIGPEGQVLVTYQSPSSDETPGTIFAHLDPDGLGPAGFGPAIAVTPTNVGGFDFIPAQADRSIDAEAGLAWDRSGGPFHGRVYLVYTDEFPNESNDTDVFVRRSDDNGATWSAPVRVNDDATTRSQFLPRLALDQVTGNIAVIWHDARNDPGNRRTQLFGTVSQDGGASFLPNVQISAGTSDEHPAGGIDYGDYTGLAFHNNTFFPAWADNSNSTGDNPDGTLSHFDVYTARVSLLPPVSNIPPVANAGSNQTVRLGSLVTLHGSGSDPDNGPGPLTFHWTQVAGPATVSLSGADTPTPTFTPTTDGIYEFVLIVNDGAANSAPSGVQIRVPKLGDVNDDGQVDKTDVALIVAARNTPANGPNDLRDLNGDGMIDVRDARLAATLCTHPLCAP